MANQNSGGDKRAVVVNIGGKDFKIMGEVNEALLRTLGAYVDGKIKEIKDKTDTVDMQKLAVLAALNIAEELHNLREENAPAANRETEAKLAELNSLLDEYLQE